MNFLEEQVNLYNKNNDAKAINEALRNSLG